MKKTALLSFFTLILTVFLGTAASANGNTNPSWFIEVPQDSMNQSQVSTYSTNLNSKSVNTSNMYYFLHNDGNNIEPTKINTFIEGDVDLSELEDFKVFGVGKYELNGKVHTHFIYSNLPKENYDDVLEDSLSIAKNLYEPNNPTTLKTRAIQTLASTKDNSDKHTFNVYNGTVLAGKYTSNVDYLYKGTSTLSGKTVSVWDVVYFNQSVPQNSYQTREIITRFSISDWANQTLRSYAPTTTPKNKSASVSISGLVPSFGWNIETFSSTITDSSSISDKYARWTFQTALGSNTAKSSYVMEPGARITNAVGQAGFKTTHNIDYYKNLNSQKVYNTGPLTRYLNDR